MKQQLAAQLHAESKFRLLELTPDLYNSVQNGENLKIKAPSGSSTELVVCTPRTTFRLRQMNQSNTLMLVRPDSTLSCDEPRVNWFGTVESFLEPTSSTGRIPLKEVPLYRGRLNGHDSTVQLETVQALKQRSPASDHEFDKLWKQNGGVEIDGVACIIDDSLCYAVLSDILASVVTSNMSFDDIEVERLYCQMGIDGEAYDESISVVTAVVEMFSQKNGSSYALEKESVTRAIGIHLLRTQARAPVAISDFHSLWKDATTIVADWPRDLSQLVGTYVCPQPDTIRYLDRATLSAEPKTRFQQLLSIKSSWDLDDIAPFIEDVAHHGVKLENFILKYARKKRAGSRIIVTQR